VNNSPPFDSLFSAIETKSVPDIRAALDAGADANGIAPNGELLLLKAICTGDDSVVRALLDAGANSNTQDARGQTPLICAAGGGFVSMTEMLLKAGADPNLADADGTTALMVATCGDYIGGGNHEPLVHLLVNAGAKVDARNRNGRTALLCASADPFTPAGCLHYLVEAGADLNARDPDGNSALMIVHRYDNDTSRTFRWKMDHRLRFLESVGANDEGVDDVRLINAAERGDWDGVRSLIAKGANINHWCSGTALMAAAKAGHLPIVEALVAAGADSTVCRREGTAAEQAEASGHTAVAVFLRQAMRLRRGEK
jgi:hypothetical protein